jgi:hypothetical protein
MSCVSRVSCTLLGALLLGMLAPAHAQNCPANFYGAGYCIQDENWVSTYSFECSAYEGKANRYCIDDGACEPCCSACANQCSGHLGLGACTACPEGTTAPAGSTTVAQCVSSAASSPPPPPTLTESDAYTPISCVACAASLYLDQDSLICKPCPTGSSTFSYSNASSPLHCMCRPGFENATTEESSACEKCTVGFFKDSLANTSCTRCHAHSSTISAGSLNIKDCLCVAGFTAHNEHENHCEPCAPGYFKQVLDNWDCEQCPADHFCPEASVDPVSCPASSSAAAGAAAVEDCHCAPGFHFARDANGSYYCQPCAPGFYNELANQAECLACPVNTFNPDMAASSSASCRACDPHAAAPAGSALAAACACNLGYAGAPGESCVACEPGTFRDENSPGHICEDCPTNTYNVFYAAVTPSACLSCHANTSSAARSRSQRACVCDPGLFGVLHMGEWNANAASASAGLGGTSDPASLLAGSAPSAAAAAPAPSLAVGPGQPADSHPALEESGYYACTPCAAGSFSLHSNTSACTPCPLGTVSGQVGAKSESVCQTCTGGSVALQSGMTACELCPPSSWQDTSLADAAARACEPCPANSSHALSAQTDIFACVCAPGLYKKSNQPPDSGFVCALCEPGHFCPGADVISACPFNTYSVGGVVTACTPCAELSRAATAAPLVGQQQCQCLPGAEGSFGEHCRLCAPGKFQPLDLTANATGATAGMDAIETTCQPCPADHFQPLAGAISCAACHAHSSTRGAVGGASPEACTCDARFLGEDGVACSLCESDTFCTGGEVATRCRPFSSSPPGSSTTADCTCNPGYYAPDGPDNPCAKCPEGRFCPGGTTSQVQHACPANASSAAGAHAVHQCFCRPGHWRGCTAGGLNAAGQTCTIVWSQPCAPCGANAICVNDTLLHCPAHSSAPPGSDEARDCVCAGGYHAEYGA